MYAFIFCFGVCGRLWAFVGVCGRLWAFVGVCGRLWAFETSRSDVRTFFGKVTVGFWGIIVRFAQFAFLYDFTRGSRRGRAMARHYCESWNREIDDVAPSGLFFLGGVEGVAELKF